MFDDEGMSMKLRNVLFTMMAMTMTATSASAMLPTPDSTQPATSQAVPVMNTQVHAYVVHTDEMGVEQLQLLTAGDSVRRGDIVEYHGLFTNQDTNRVRSMNVTLGIPQGVELIGAVQPNIVKASIDGNRFVYMPIRGTLNGKVQELPLSYYKALRWTVEDLGIGATAVVKYRARVQ